MKYKGQDPYLTYTPKAIVEICEHCPYKAPKCGVNGCDHFKENKKMILEQQRAERSKQKAQKKKRKRRKRDEGTKEQQICL